MEAALALLVLAGVAVWMWLRSPFVHQMRRRRVVQAADLVAVSAIAVARFERTRQFADSSVPDRLKEPNQTALALMERTAVCTGANAARLRAMWLADTPNERGAALADAVAADSARAALADARSPLTPELVETMTPPEVHATLVNTYAGTDDMLAYISRLSLLGLYMADVGKRQVALLNKAVGGLSERDRAMFDWASECAETDADAVL